MSGTEGRLEDSQGSTISDWYSNTAGEMSEIVGYVLP